METLFKDISLPTFQDKELETIMIDSLDNIHDFNDQIIRLIQERDKVK
jgi:hypothetical protein